MDCVSALISQDKISFKTAEDKVRMLGRTNGIKCCINDLCMIIESEAFESKINTGEIKFPTTRYELLYPNIRKNRIGQLYLIINN